MPTERAAHVTLELGKGAEHVHWLRFRIDPQRQLLFRGDGEVKTEGAHVTWTPPRTGGKLTYVFRIDHLRDARRYDARCAKTWTIFRGEDLVPPARVLVDDGARSRTRLRVRLPEGWSIATPYTKLRSGEYRVAHRRRGLSRPTGWMIAGVLGVVREEVSGVRVAIAGPKSMDVRRQDMLALLRWTLPDPAPGPDRAARAAAHRLRLRPDVARRSLGPRLAVHPRAPAADHRARPEPAAPRGHAHGAAACARATTATGRSRAWRSSTRCSCWAARARSRPSAWQRDYEFQAERGKEAEHLRSKTVSGAGTSRAVTVLRALDAKIREATQEKKSLDDVLRILVARGRRAHDRAHAEDLRAGLGSEPRRVLQDPGAVAATPRKCGITSRAISSRCSSLHSGGRPGGTVQP